jgi:hypothetical protein
MRHCCKISLQQNGGTKKQKTKRKEQRMIVSMYSRQTRVDCDVSKRYNNRRSLPPKCILSCDPLYTFCHFCFLSYQSPLARCSASNRISLLGTRTCRAMNGMTLSLSGAFWRLLRVFSAPLWQSGMACGCLSTRKVSSAELGGVEKCWGSGVELEVGRDRGAVSDGI